MRRTLRKASAGGHMPPLNILVVDDEQIVALDIRRTLERLGYTVPAIVADGPTAIRKATELRPGLVLMDIRLKGEMDGIQAAGIISGKLKIPVIYLTAYSDQATLERAKTSNPFGFLIKPFEERELHSTIEIALLKHSAERRLEDARRKAEQENLAKSGYFADMSHEIRNSLNGIMGMADLALDTPLSDEQREYLSTIMDSAENLLAILNDVLDISRIEARRLSLTEKPFDIARTVAKAVRSVKPDAEKKGLRLSYHLGPGVPATVQGDSGRLHQILTNLLGNAVKFTEDGTIVVEINLVKGGTPEMPEAHSGTASESLQLLFSVRDTGIGIPDNRLSAIFERYRQVDRETEQAHVGSGLGLAICKELVDLMDGKMWVRSRLNHGSTFYFTAHFTPCERHVPDIRRSGILQAGSRQSMRRLNVLTADDNLVSRNLVRMLLEKQGHSCTTASNGLEMLVLLAQDRYDLVLTNIQMPRMGGLEAVRRIRSGTADGVPQDIPIIAVTAHALKGDRERFIDAGMTDYIAKPLHAERFYEVINRVFTNERTAEEETPPAHQGEVLPLLDTADVLRRMQGDTLLVREMWQSFLSDSHEQMADIREALRGQGSRLDITRAEVSLGATMALATASRNIGAPELAAAADLCADALRHGERDRAATAIRRLEETLSHTLSIMDTSMKSL